MGAAQCNTAFCGQALLGRAPTGRVALGAALVSQLELRRRSHCRPLNRVTRCSASCVAPVGELAVSDIAPAPAASAQRVWLEDGDPTSRTLLSGSLAAISVRQRRGKFGCAAQLVLTSSQRARADATAEEDAS